MNSERLILFLVAFATPATAQFVVFTVSETAGRRRFGYPVTASLESNAGLIMTAEKVRLIAAVGKAKLAQFTTRMTKPGADIYHGPALNPWGILVVKKLP